MSERMNASQWSEYWDNKSAISFHGDFKNKHDGQIKSFWEGIFARQPEDAKIVDLGTGNGALAILAQKYSDNHGLHFRISGIDSARVNPAKALAQLGKPTEAAKRIQFLSRTIIEDTKLPEETFDLVMSQFGFEHADQAAASAEVVRLLKPEGGTFAAMIHHADSAVLKVAADALREIKHCEGTHLLDIAEKIISLQEILLRHGKLNEKEMAQIKFLNQTFSQNILQVKILIKQLKDPGHLGFFVDKIMHIFDRNQVETVTLKERRLTVEKLRAQTDAYKLRMTDLDSVALSKADFEVLAKRLEFLGLRGELMAPFHYGDLFYCMSLVATTV
jgi:ubiquinone/menaquinone biosynthesis C-methylase UbiE